MVIYIPLASVAEKRSALKIALNQLDITSKALSVDQSHLEVKEGDVVVAAECRPIAKSVSFVVVEVKE